MYMSFVDKVNREALWQVQRMYDVRCKLLDGIKSMYVTSLPCVTENGGESKCFRINNDVRQVFIISPWFLNISMDTVMKKWKWG